VLRWELSSTTALDYLDHILERLCLPPALPRTALRRKTENLIALAALDYSFSYKPPSLVAASAIFIALRSCIADRPVSMTCLLSEEAARREELHHLKLLREAKMCLQMLSLAGGQALDSCCLYLAETMPEKLTGHERMGPLPASPDSTMAVPASPPARRPDHSAWDGVSSSTSPLHLTSTPARAGRTPDFCSAVDVFSDFNSSVLQVVLNPNDSQTMSNSILCS
jgi:hypothetical protein